MTGGCKFCGKSTNGEYCSELCEQLAYLFTRAAAAHAFQDRIVYMLYRDVKVFDDLRVFSYLVYQLIVERFGIKVVQPDPLDTLYSGKLSAQLGKTSSGVDVRTVSGDILRDHDQFLHAGSS